MDRRRAFWLVMWPAVSVLAALVVGVVAVGTASLAAGPDSVDDTSGLQLVLDRAAEKGELGVGELTGSPAALAALVLMALAWLVVLGMGAQRYFPPRRRLAAAALAVAATALVMAAGLALSSGAGALTLADLVRLAGTSALVGGVIVFLAAGYRWRAETPHHHHHEPPVYGHLADIL